MMHNELTNLLPSDRQHALRRDYFIRLSTIAALLVTALTIATAILLIPTYVFLTASYSASKTRLANIGSTISSSEDVALSAQLATLSNNTKILSALADEYSISTIMRAVIAIPRPGVVLSSFAYSPVVGKKQRTLEISGEAATRDALRAYQLALQKAPFASSADLPVSAYAKDSDITFTITVTLLP